MSSSKKDEFNRTDYKWSSAMQQALSVFSLSEFRSSQLSIINATMSGFDVLGLMATGGGKSLTYQLPALLTDGVTLVVSPLLSLIGDQVLYLNSIDIPATSLTGSCTQSEQNAIKHDLETVHQIKLLYVTPERITSPAFIDILLKIKHRIQRFVIDESHCLSNWGSDFRPDYTGLGMLKEKFPTVPILALTATATVTVKADIVKTLGFRTDRMATFQSTFNRPNLVYSVATKTGAVIDDMFLFIRTSKMLGCTGIIYCFSKNDCEEVASQLNTRFQKYATLERHEYAATLRTSGQSACVRFCDFYHAGMDKGSREKVQAMWMNNEIHVVVATIAFGMGIDKPDVRFVLHHTLSKSIEGYYQESGRAGRDGKSSLCRIYYHKSDTEKLKYILTNQEKTNADRQAKGYDDVTSKTIQTNLSNLAKMTSYCENTVDCRRYIQLDYFEEQFDHRECRGMCDNCGKSLQIPITSFFKKSKPVDLTAVERDAVSNITSPYFK